MKSNSFFGLPCFCAVSMVLSGTALALEPVNPADKYPLSGGVPADLLIPEDATLMSAGPANAHSGSGIMFDGQWLNSHGHFTGFLENPYPEGKLIFVDEAPYYVGSGSVRIDSNFFLLDLADENGVPVTAPGVQTPKPMQYPLQGMTTTIGGFGDVNDGERAQLRWGTQVITQRISPAGQGERFNKLTSGIDPQLAPKYLSTGEAGDSGSASWVRDGWDWRLFGTNEHSDVARYQTAIAQVIPSFTFAGNSTVPAATAQWNSAASGDWSVAANWQAGVLPTSSDTVAIDQPAAVQVTAGVAQGNDLFVGSALPGGSFAAVNVQGGSLELADTLYLGAEVQTRGEASLGSGQITAKRAYIGYQGEGAFTQTGGTHTLEGLLVVGKAAGSDGTYSISGAQSRLQALSIVVAAEPGSNGTMNVLGAEEVRSHFLTVGHDGNGAMNQSGGLVNVDDLQVGLRPDAQGAYQLSGGTLQSKKVNIGGILPDGLGQFGTGVVTQTGGTHSVTDALSINQTGRYELEGGTLEVAVGARIAGDASGVDGVLDFNNGTGQLAFTGGGIADIRELAIANAGNATLDVIANGLVVHDLGSAPSAFGQIGPHTAHLDGTTLQMSNGQVIVAAGTIDDPVTVLGSASLMAPVGQDLHLDNGLFLGAVGSVNLGDGTLTVPGGSSATIYGSFSAGEIRATGTSSNPSIISAAGPIDAAIHLGAGNTLEVVSPRPKLTLLAPLSVNVNSTVTAGPGQSINLTQGLNAAASVVGSANINLGDGVLTVPSGTTSVAQVATPLLGAGVTLEADGQLNASGTFTVDTFIHQGNLSIVGPGDPNRTTTVTIDGAYVAADSASLEVQLGSVRFFGPRHDRLVLTEPVAIDGTLDIVQALDSNQLPFVPGIGDQFQIVTATGGLTGAFDAVTGLTDFQGVSLGLLYDSLSGTVTIESVLEGDLDGDGFVGVDDLNVVLINWNLNVSPGVLASGDFTGDGFVGAEDLNIVLTNWNNGVPGAPPVVVPEPGSLLALLVLGATRLQRPRRDSKKMQL